MSLTDPHRPALHLVGDPWLNDPIPYFHEGDWHLFYQHNPAKAFWGDMCWGHAVSRDLVRWQRLPNALTPTPGHCDQRGCWTGSILNARGGFHLFYTAIPQFQPEFRQVQALATSQDLIHWDKYTGNPLIHGKPAGAGTCFRDPCVFEEDGGYTMVVGSEKKDGSGGLALRYRSDDLLRWTYAGVMYEGTTESSGFDFECPDFFPMSPELHCLLTSRNRQWAHVGRYDGGRFAAGSVRQIEGPSFYAGKTAVDGAGRRLLWGWVMDATAGPGLPEDPALVSRGWAGVMSLPRELYLDPAGRLGQRPPRELEGLRRRHHVVGGFDCSSYRRLDGVRGACLEVRMVFDCRRASAVGLAVREAEGGGERTMVTYRRAGGMLDSVPCGADPASPIELRVFLDHSVIESFCAGTASTQRCFPTDPARAMAMGVWADGPIRVLECEAWELGV